MAQAALGASSPAAGAIASAATRPRNSSVPETTATGTSGEAEVLEPPALREAVAEAARRIAAAHRE
ncbi:MAG TPA: hypothetical protein DFS52_32380 [Myxococcales bacterium]|nr:hypothetical protein [Myxococcales bacterium]